MLARRGLAQGLGGTGFVASDGERGPYATRLPTLRALDYDELVLQVSGNDAKHPVALVYSEADKFLAQLPERPTVVLGPMWALDGADALPALDAAIGDLVRARGLPYIPILGWLAPRDIHPDGAHPTRKGHLRIALRARHPVHVRLSRR